MAPARCSQADRAVAVLARRPEAGGTGGVGRRRPDPAGRRDPDAPPPASRAGPDRESAGPGGAVEGSAAPAPVGAGIPVRQRHQHGTHHGRLRSLRGGPRGGRPHGDGGGGVASGEGQAAPAQALERPRRAQRQAERQRGRLLAPARCALPARRRRRRCAARLRQGGGSGARECRSADAGGRPLSARGQSRCGRGGVPASDRARQQGQRQHRRRAGALSRQHHAGRRAGGEGRARRGDGGLHAGSARGQDAVGAWRGARGAEARSVGDV